MFQCESFFFPVVYIYSLYCVKYCFFWLYSLGGRLKQNLHIEFFLGGGVLSVLILQMTQQTL